MRVQVECTVLNRFIKIKINKPTTSNYLVINNGQTKCDVPRPPSS